MRKEITLASDQARETDINPNAYNMINWTISQLTDMVEKGDGKIVVVNLTINVQAGEGQKVVTNNAKETES